MTHHPVRGKYHGYSSHHTSQERQELDVGYHPFYGLTDHLKGKILLELEHCPNIKLILFILSHLKQKSLPQDQKYIYTFRRVGSR